MNTVDEFWAAVQRSPECWVWQRSTSGGYGHLLWRGERMRAHRVAWTITCGPIPDGLWVLHHCDNPPCVRPEHLFLGTSSDNLKDAHRKGRGARDNLVRAMLAHPERRARGEGHGQAVLTEREVMFIRESRLNGVSMYRLAKDLGVGKTTIRDVVSGHTWSHLWAAESQARYAEQVSQES